MPAGNGKHRRGSPGSRDPRAENHVRIHALKNTLASLRLRLGMVAADPTCRWAQEENLTALVDIANEAMSQAAELDRATQPALAELRRRRSASAVPVKRGRR